MLKHIALRLIKSESFWHSIKIIVILLWNYKFVTDRFELAAVTTQGKALATSALYLKRTSYN